MAVMRPVAASTCATRGSADDQLNESVSRFRSPQEDSATLAVKVAPTATAVSRGVSEMRNSSVHAPGPKGLFVHALGASARSVAATDRRMALPREVMSANGHPAR